MNPKIIKAVVGIFGILLALAGDLVIEKNKRKKGGEND